MSSTVDEDNKRILEKFRIDAIKHRNQRVMKHLGCLPYITESMLPGMNVNPSIFMDSRVDRNPIQMNRQAYPTVEVRRVVEEPSRIATPVILKPKSLVTKKSIGVDANFEDEFPLAKKKKELKKQYYTIENYEEELAFDKIGNMLSQINQKLSHNT